MRLLPVLVSALLAAPCLAQSGSDADFTTLPPDPAEMQQRLEGLAVDMAAAAEAVEKQGARVNAIRLVQEDGNWVYEVSLLHDGVPKRAIVNAATGEVTMARLNSVEAAAAARRAVDGRIGLMSVDTASEPPVWRVMVFREGKAHKITVNAIDGSITGDEIQSRFPGESTDAPLQGEAGGLQWIVMREGTGEPPKGPDSRVKVNYSGYLVDGRMFDSNAKSGKPVEFPLNRVIKGWTQGVGMMKVGEKRKLVIPYAMAYGEAGRPPTIPARATLIFDVELLEADMPPAAAPVPGAPQGGG